jgi:hypothetical protein
MLFDPPRAFMRQATELLGKKPNTKLRNAAIAHDDDRLTLASSQPAGSSSSRIPAWIPASSTDNRAYGFIAYHGSLCYSLWAPEIKSLINYP